MALHDKACTPLLGERARVSHVPLVTTNDCSRECILKLQKVSGCHSPERLPLRIPRDTGSAGVTV